MNDRSSLSPASKLTVVALLIAAAGIVIQIVAGIDFPTIPPGLIILLVAAGLVAFGRWWWTPIVGTVVGLSQFIGLFLADQGERLLDLGPLGGFVGIWVQLLAVSVAIVAGIIATIQNNRHRTRP